MQPLDLQALQGLVADTFDKRKFLDQPTELYDPIDYTLRLGGKRIRPTLLLAAHQLFGGNPQQVLHAAVAVEAFHNFTLLHDDLMDRSPLRRGQPTVYRKWGDNAAILSGDTLYALSWRYLLEKPHPRLHEIAQCFNETAIEVCEGQQKDMNFEQLEMDEVSLDDYKDMIYQKTAILLACALKMGALYADAPAREVDRLFDFGIHIGLAFQLQDDLLDGYGDTAVFGKKTGQDIRDNKKTFLPLMAALRCNPEQKKELVGLFAAKRNKEMDEEEKVRRVMALYDAIDLRKALGESIDKEFEAANRCMDDIQADEALKWPLRQLMETLSNRKK